MSRADSPLAFIREGLAPHSAVPIYKQLYGRIRVAIDTGVMPAGTKLPSSRTLCEQLSISRGTVKTAYDMLSGEGYVLGHGAAGTIVAPRGKGTTPSRARSVAAAKPATKADVTLLRMGVPALDAFPYKSWSRLIMQQARRSIHSHSPDHPEYTFGSVRLRAAVVNYLALTRGITCTGDQVFITAGYQGALGLITRALLSHGDEIWFEEPGYVRAREALVLAGAKLVPVPVDAEGMNVSVGIERAPRARMAIVTPSHQAPLGMAMSMERRHALLAWSQRVGSWIVEDDYYSEFWYTTRQIPALKSLDDGGRVLYTGTFSKVMHPSLRLGYIVVPNELVELFARTIALLSPGPALLNQHALADFIEQGFFSRHIKRMRQLYAQRRNAMIATIQSRAGHALRLEEQPGGMHLVAYLPANTDDVRLAQIAARQGYGIYALSQWYLGDSARPGLLLSFANVPADQADAEVEKLLRVLGL